LSGLALSATLLAALSGVLLATLTPALLSTLSGLLFLLTRLLLSAALLATTLLTALVLILRHGFLRWFLNLRQRQEVAKVPVVVPCG
jgi:hypothetical protein